MKSIIFLALLTGIVFLSGCTTTNNGDIEYSDDAITLENFAIQTQVRPGRTIPIDFTVVNNVERPVENVLIEISNAGGFEVTSVKCEDFGGMSKLLQKETGYYLDNDMGCFYNEIESLDSRDIHFTLRAKTSEELGHVDPYDADITVGIEYDYNGETVIIFPVLEYRETTEREMSMGQSYGPIHIDIKPGFLLEYEEDGRTITERDWATKDIAFDIEVASEDIGSTKSGYDDRIELEPFEIELEGVVVDEETKYECDFDGETFLTPKNPIELPMSSPLICTFLPEQDPGKLTLRYEYRYKFERKETVTITKEMF